MLSVVRACLDSRKAEIYFQEKVDNAIPFVVGHAGRFESAEIPSGGYLCQVVEFLIAPKKGLYTAEELNGLMYDLAPGLEPSENRPFCEQGEGRGRCLCYGRLFYSEVIGHDKTFRVISLMDTDSM